MPDTLSLQDVRNSLEEARNRISVAQSTTEAERILGSIHMAMIELKFALKAAESVAASHSAALRAQIPGQMALDDSAAVDVSESRAAAGTLDAEEDEPYSEP